MSGVVGRGRGMSAKSLKLINDAKLILERIHPATVRGVCYQLFVLKLIPDMSEKSTKDVSNKLTAAREKGMIPWPHIVDETRNEERISAWDGLGDFGDTVTRRYRKDFWSHQPAWIKVFSEKSTIGGVLRPILNEFAVSFQVMHGYGSTTKMYDIAQESLDPDKPTLEILYVGDYDPSGMHMSEVDLPERLERYGGVADISRIALMRDDCDGLEPFSIEEKKKDSRLPWFQERYGDLCWELDAMDPNDLRARVREEIVSRIDMAAWLHCKKTEDAEKESLNRYVKAWPRG